MKNHLVTGGAGFIGSHLVEALLARGDRVVVIDDESTGNRDHLLAAKQDPLFEYHHGSVGDADLVRRSMEGIDRVYHLAAAVGVSLIARAPIETIERNVYPTQLVLSELHRQQEEGRDVKLFLASTSEVYGKNPKPIWHEEEDLVFGATTRTRWSYGVSKAIDEFLALAYWRQYRMPIVVGRFFNVVGPRQSGAYGMVLPRFVDAAKAGLPLVVHDDGAQQRCFAHVSDVISMVLDLMDTPDAVGQVINIGSDQPISIRSLAEKVIANAGTESEIQFQSYADAYDKDFEDVRVRVPNLTRLRGLIDYQPEYDLDGIVAQLLR